MAKSSGTTKALELVVILVLLYEGWKHQDVIKGWLDKFSSSLQSQIGSGSGSGSTAPDNTNTDTSGTDNSAPTADTSNSTPDTSSIDNSAPSADSGNGGDTGGVAQAAPDTSNQDQAVQPTPAPAPQSVGIVAPAPAPAVAVNTLNCPSVIGPGCPDCCNINGNCVCKGNSNCPCNGCPSTVGTCAGDVIPAPVVVPAKPGRNIIPARHLNPRQRGLIQHHPPVTVHPPVAHPTTTNRPIKPGTKPSAIPALTNPPFRGNVPPQNLRNVHPNPRQRGLVKHPPSATHTITPSLPQCTNSLPCGNTCLSGGARRIVCCLSGGVKTFVVNEAACHAQTHSTGL